MSQKSQDKELLAILVGAVIGAAVAYSAVSSDDAKKWFTPKGIDRINKLLDSVEKEGKDQEDKEEVEGSS